MFLFQSPQYLSIDSKFAPSYPTEKKRLFFKPVGFENDVGDALLFFWGKAM